MMASLRRKNERHRDHTRAGRRGRQTSNDLGRRKGLRQQRVVASCDGIVVALQSRQIVSDHQEPIENAAQGAVRGQGLSGALDDRPE